MLDKQQKRQKRHKRVRAKIFGTAKRPRLCVFRSCQHIYAQLIDDENGKTLVSAGDMELKGLKTKLTSGGQKLKSDKTVLADKDENKEKKRTGKLDLAFRVGKLIAQKAKKKKIENVVFDRGGYKYHGRVKALAEGAREEKLLF